MSDASTTGTDAANDARRRTTDNATGLRHAGDSMARLLAFAAVGWSALQLWVASPLPELFGVLVLNETKVRSLHLAFAVLLAFLAYPARRGASGPPPRIDLVLAVLAALSAAYLSVFYDSVSAHTGDPTGLEIAVAACGLALLLEATRRVLGLPMVVMALVLLGYVFFGERMPELIAHKGASFGRTMSHMWLTTEGVFGVALGVSAGLIFLFVLFGALLETAGAGSYFIRSAVALLGHMRGGPAKAAVVASAATGLISGSSITNVVTTGPLTIPLIKRVGYPAEKAAAIECAASVNGQVMPPVMGAAAFLMVEYVGVPYVQVLKHALISAMVSYLGLLYIVHLEAVKADLRGLPRQRSRRWHRAMASFALGFLGIALVLTVVSVIGSLVHAALPQLSFLVMALLLLAAYVVLLRMSLPHAGEVSPADAPITALPPFGPTLRSGMHFLLPVGALVWNLVVEQLAPTRAAFWATLFLAFIVLTQRPLLAWFRGEHGIGDASRRGLQDLIDGLAAGARNMVAVAIATATAGIIVGTVTLTGVGLVMTELVTALSGGNIIVMLALVALICLVLGMGLPTTANYIVVSSLMAPVIVAIGAQNGLFVPLIAAHLFVFYFGLMADITPPVGLASYAAASIAIANPIRTGIIAFRYSMRMALLPFMFVLNPKLLLIGVDGLGHTFITLASATLAGFAFISVNQGWLLVRSTGTERLAMLLAVFMLFNPGMFMDPLSPPYTQLTGTAAEQAIVEAPADTRMRVLFAGTTLEGDAVERGILLPLGKPAATATRRLADNGIGTVISEAGFTVTRVEFGSQAAKLGVEAGFRVIAVEVPGNRIAREWMFLPALMLIAWVLRRQRLRYAPAPA
ncbi:TRAP transporter permease [Cognatazoarcus halotolerans]|uniref:TRAP transporter permease n=1 Tax=Cognatazoarcus halotolerans TaxID=2686016 RepID=UPI0013593E4C|nr:TRAP transporter permease [Cognatazoarcus halotolerans]MCB1897712.1 TRAP transporter permease [Rhodocyclaceae bacterium]MCP5310706.1 TRAP transporter permease [Zoogloeaceae bacterium]